MKKIIALALALFASSAFAQTFAVQDLVVNGTATAPTPATGTNNTQLATMHALAAHAPCQTIIDYGGNNGGAVDNTAALNAAIAAQPSNQVCVYFPAGKYLFSSPYTYAVNAGTSVTIIGAGADITNLYWPSGSGLKINVGGSTASAHVRDLTLLTGSSNTGDALTLNQTVTSIGNPANTALSDITNVTCRGNDGYVVSNYWSDCISVNSVSNINFTNLFATTSPAINGNGVHLKGTATALGVVYNFQGCTFNYTQFGIFYDSYIQGVTVNQSNFTGGSTGIISPTGAVATSQLSVTGSQFNNSSVGIALQASVPGTQILGNVFIVTLPGTMGVAITNPGLYGIIGNNFQGSVATGSTGVSLTGASSSGVITGNMFFRMATAISLSASTAGVNVQSNSYNSNTTNVSNASGSNSVGGGSQ